MRTKNIAFILGSKQVGGIEKVAEDLSSGLFERGYNIHHIMLISDFSREIKLTGNILSVLPQGNNLLQKAIIFMHRIYRVNNIKKTYDFDAVISFGDAANIVNIITRNKEKVIITIHENPNSENNCKGITKRLYHVLTSWLYPKADNVIAVSKQIMTILQQRLQIPVNKLKIIYNGVNIDKVKKKGSEDALWDNFDKQCFYIANVGRLVKEKGQWHLIRIMPALIRCYPQVRLVITGTGYLKGELWELVKKMRLEKFVIMTGYQKNPYRYMKNCDLYVQTSLSEAFPLVIVEAMALGLPIVSADTVAGPREIIADNELYDDNIKEISYCKYGLLTERMPKSTKINNDELSSEENSLLQAIKKMIEDENLRRHYANEAVIRAEDFSVDRMIDGYEKLLKK